MPVRNAEALTHESRSPAGKNSRYLLGIGKAEACLTRRSLGFSTRPWRKPRKYLVKSGTTSRVCLAQPHNPFSASGTLNAGAKKIEFLHGNARGPL